jgi:hypothetical protein
MEQASCIHMVHAYRVACQAATLTGGNHCSTCRRSPSASKGKQYVSATWSRYANGGVNFVFPGTFGTSRDGRH